MAVRSSDFLVCPACRAKNSVTRETCARCGESLQDVTAATTLPPTPQTLVIPGLSPPETPPPPSEGMTFRDLVGLVAVVILFVVGFKNADVPPKPTANPALFTLPTLAPARPRPTPVPEPPGGRDFEEGRRLLAKGEASSAIPFLSRAVAAAPGNAIYHDLLGQAYWASGSKDSAFSQYAEGGRLDRARFGTRLAEQLLAAGREADAVRAYQDVLRAAPDDPQAQEGLGRLQYLEGNYARAVPLFRGAAKARPDDPVLQQELGYSLQATGDTAGAIAVYRSVLTLVPGADVSRGLLAGLLYDKGEEEAAIGLVREGLQQNPQAPNLHLNLANMLERSGHSQEAAQNYREYARLAPNAPDAKQFEERADRLDSASGGS